MIYQSTTIYLPFENGRAGATRGSNHFDVPLAPVFPVLKGKVAIVTGAAMGMGKATAMVSICPFYSPM